MSSWGGGGGGLVETNFQFLMLSPNLLKSKKKFSRGLAKNFLSFRAKKCLGMVLDFEYQVVRIYEVYANHNHSTDMASFIIRLRNHINGNQINWKLRNRYHVIKSTLDNKNTS